MMRRMLVIGLALCLAPIGLGCRDTGTQETSAKRKSAARASLIKRYDPRKHVQDWVEATKGQGEGEKVKVYLSPSTKDMVIGQLNFGTLVVVVDQAPGWYGVRYHSRDGGEFYGWIRSEQARERGTVLPDNEVIAVEDPNQGPLSIQEADEEMRRILGVPYRIAQGAGGEKQFWGGKDPEGYDDISLLNRLQVTGETTRWAGQCQIELRKLSARTPAAYRQVLGAYYDALGWYVSGNKSQFTKMLKQADDKRNEFARHFGN